MTVETMTARCPNCLKIKTINKTDKNVQVRCTKRDGGCGAKYYTQKNIVLEKKTIIKTNKTEIRTFDGTKKTLFNLDLEKFNGSLESLIIAMNYAINTIKNKREVVAKDINSTRYQHFLSWTKWRKTFQMELTNQ